MIMAVIVLGGCAKQEKTGTGQIFLYGEAHAEEKILERELQIWQEYYQDGMRDLFIEYPHYTAQFLNMWMKAEDDKILDELYEDWNGSLGHFEVVRAFYKAIKENCPETVFHGTDVGHTYDTTGKRYLEYLEDNGLKDSGEYTLAEEIIEQGKHYHENRNVLLREYKMVENFVREYEKLDGSSVMGIYGADHVRFDMAGNMACQLRDKYGEEKIKSEDLSIIAKQIEPIKTEEICLGGKEYTATYYYKEDISAIFPEYKAREFWRVEDAYEDFCDNEVTGDNLPCNDYPMEVKEKQVFMIDYIREDGTLERKYYRSDGNMFMGQLTTEEFEVN